MIKEVYGEGKETARFHLENSTILTREANSTLLITMAAGLGALGYTARLIEEGASSQLVVAVGLVAIHLLLVAVFLVRKCLSAADIMPVTNEPRNLYQKDFEWEQVLEAELGNLDARIQFNQLRNKVVGTWLNGLRYAAFAAPLTFLVAWLVGSALRNS